MVIALSVGSYISVAAQARLVGTPHDLGSGLCDYCHTPPAGTASKSQVWSSQAPIDAGFSMYDSPRLTYASGGQPRSVSLVCLSCHDGATSANMLLNAAGARGAGYSGGIRHGLIGSHPVSVAYNRSHRLDFRKVNERSVNGLPLYGSSESGDGPNQVECASCHNPHDETYGTYLRAANDRSALCLNCHIK